MKIIEVHNLSKSYRIVHERVPYYSFRDELVNSVKKSIRWMQGYKETKEDFWTLKDISFSVERGEVLGIIGKNGAGKTTLLKILSQITPPTRGQAIIRGRLSSLLEVGTGFHPELTGKENIFLNGAILGMSKKEIAKKFDEIVDFAGIEKFIDTPVKRYSSGMFVRLAFSVAAHMEPDILLVDEVLAVGDVEFQKKCLGKMEEVTKKTGRTILFVSHNMGAIQNLCQRCILLDKGKIKMIGRTKDVVSEYLNTRIKNESLLEFPKDKNKKAQIRKIRVLNHKGVTTTELELNKPFSIEIEYDVNEIAIGLYVWLSCFNEQGVLIFTSADIDSNPELLKYREIGRHKTVFSLLPGPGIFLNNSRYIFKINLAYKESHDVIVSLKDYYNKLPSHPGTILLNPSWKNIY